jgi:hypothetical protein
MILFNILIFVIVISLSFLFMYHFPKLMKYVDKLFGSRTGIN